MNDIKGFDPNSKYRVYFLTILVLAYRLVDSSHVDCQSSNSSTATACGQRRYIYFFNLTWYRKRYADFGVAWKH